MSEVHRCGLFDRPPPKSSKPLAVSLAIALFCHTVAGWAAVNLDAGSERESRVSMKVSELIEIETPEPKPEPKAEAEAEPPPPPKPTTPPKAVKAPPPPPKPASETPPPEAAPPPAAAQAGKVMTSEEEIVDFGDAFVVGTAKSYAGGVTEAGGTSEKAVRDTRARAGGVEGGTGSTLGADLSRPPRLAGGSRWDCPLPPDARAAGVTKAAVILEVEVDERGRMLRVRIKEEPGFGFGREARRCAAGKNWEPGLDVNGRPTRMRQMVRVTW
ncbi:MAG: hypothetical protein AAGD10_10730 [Myxococcota bacterium]